MSFIEEMIMNILEFLKKEIEGNFEFDGGVIYED